MRMARPITRKGQARLASVQRFRGKVAVVTGSSSGIGQAIAFNLATEGATVALVDKDPSPVVRLRPGRASARGRLLPYRIDLEKDLEIRRLSGRFGSDLGGVDILVHCAGAFSMGDVESSRMKDFDHLYRINVRAPYRLTQLLLPLLKVRQGQIVFINSSLGLQSKGGLAAYEATKHALRVIADALRSEVNSAGLRVLSIYPGRTATPMQAKIFELEGRPYAPERLLQPADIARMVLAALSLDRSAEITDIHIRSARKWD